MLNSKPINNLVFVDIETIPQHSSFYKMSLTMQELFLKRFKREAEEMIGLIMDDWNVSSLDTPEWRPKLEKFYQNRAALQPETAQICCISLGYFKTKFPIELLTLPEDLELEFVTKSFAGTDEVKILKDFHASCATILNRAINHTHHLVGFNSNVFDFPMIAKRMLINYLPLPTFFDVSDLKPWLREHWVDVKEAYRFGVYDSNASLALLCEVFGVESPKGDIQGKDIAKVYYEIGDVNRIAKYCNNDVKATAEVYLRLKGIKNKVVMI